MSGFNIVGYKFKKGATAFLKEAVEGIELTLIAEPTNQYDPYAVAVVFMHGTDEEKPLGYIAKAEAAVISRELAVRDEKSLKATLKKPFPLVYEAHPVDTAFVKTN